MSADATAGYPATFTFDPPETIARWRVIGNFILAIPHFIILYVLNIVAEVLAFVAWILGVITGKVPEGILGVIAMYIRYSTRVNVYAMFLKEEYPPFTFATTLADPGDDPRVRVDFASETEGRNRLTIFFRLLLAIPHIIVISLIGIVAFFVFVIAWFAVLFTGRWPAGLRNFVIGLTRWVTRLNAYMYLLTDKYPPFSFE
jgi:hypothetical protein